MEDTQWSYTRKCNMRLKNITTYSFFSFCNYYLCRVKRKFANTSFMANVLKDKKEHIKL